MNCPATLWDLPGLTCTRPAGHIDGHAYESTTADEHADGES